MALTGDTDADLGTADLPRIASSSFTRRCSAAAFSRVAWATASDLAVARGNSTGEPKCGAGRARKAGDSFIGDGDSDGKPNGEGAVTRRVASPASTDDASSMLRPPELGFWLEIAAVPPKPLPRAASSA